MSDARDGTPPDGPGDGSGGEEPVGSVGEEAANRLAADKGYRSWVQYMQFLNDGHLNTDLPVLDLNNDDGRVQ